jgi:hypothetical protein
MPTGAKEIVNLTVNGKETLRLSKVFSFIISL